MDLDRKIQVRLSDGANGKIINAKLPADVPISQLLPALIIKLQLQENDSSLGLMHDRSARFLGQSETLNSAGVYDGDYLRLAPTLAPPIVVRVPLEEPAEKVQVRITDQAGGKTVNAKLPASVPTRQLLTALIVKMGLPSGTAYFMVHKESGRKLNDADTLYSAGVCHGDTLRLVPDVTAGGIAIRSYRDLQIIDMYLNRKQLETDNKYKLFALFLYTTADSTLSQFVRKQFMELQYMGAGTDFQFYIIEKPDNKWLPIMREELTEKLGPHIERVWKILEANEFHPVDSDAVYDIAFRLKVERKQLPCAVFFTALDSHQVLIVPFETLLDHPVGGTGDEELLLMFRQLHDQISIRLSLGPDNILAELKEAFVQPEKDWNWGDAFPQIALATLTEAIKAIISGMVSTLLK